jgi:tetratricopeptide (TPR) repeat protein
MAKKDVTGEQQKTSALAHKSKKQKKNSLTLAMAFIAILALAVVVAGTLVYVERQMKAEGERMERSDLPSIEQIYFRDLDASQSEAMALIDAGEYEAAQLLAAKSVAEAERLGNNEVYVAKFYQAMILINSGNRQSALPILIELLDMNVEQRLLPDILVTLVDVYRGLNDNANEKRYLEQLIALSGDNAPMEYLERLGELDD